MLDDYLPPSTNRIPLRSFVRSKLAPENGWVKPSLYISIMYLSIPKKLKITIFDLAYLRALLR